MIENILIIVLWTVFVRLARQFTTLPAIYSRNFFIFAILLFLQCLQKVSRKEKLQDLIFNFKSALKILSIRIKMKNAHFRGERLSRD